MINPARLNRLWEKCPELRPTDYCEPLNYFEGACNYWGFGGRPLSTGIVESIIRDAIVEWHVSVLCGDEMVLFTKGSYTTEEIVRSAEQSLGLSAWEKPS